jgi:hypothetical protein
VRNLAIALACTSLAGCGRLYRPVTPRVATSTSTQVRAEGLEVTASPTFSVHPPEAHVTATLVIETARAMNIEAIAMATGDGQSCGAGAAARKVVIIGEKRVLWMKLPTIDEVRLPYESRHSRATLTARFANAATGRDLGPAAIDVTFRDEAGSMGECLRLPLRSGTLEASWAERPRIYVGFISGAAFFSRAGTSDVWDYLGRVTVGSWVGPVRTGLEYSWGGPFAVAGDTVVRRWYRIGLAPGVAYEVWPDGTETRHGPRAGLRLDWLPVPTAWPGFEDHQAPNALGLELQVSRWWGASGAPDAWVFRLGLSGYLSHLVKK